MDERKQWCENIEMEWEEFKAKTLSEDKEAIFRKCFEIDFKWAIRDFVTEVVPCFGDEYTDEEVKVCLSFGTNFLEELYEYYEYDLDIAEKYSPVEVWNDTHDVICEFVKHIKASL